MLVRKTKEQKKYLLQMKSDISDSLINFKKRYQLFPWSQVNKVSKLKINSMTPINVNGTDFTVKSLVKEINKTKTKLQSRMRPSYFNYILKAYIKDSMNKDNNQLKILYNQYKEEIDNVCKEMQSDLLFCLEGLRQMNRALKPEKKKIQKNTTVQESVDDTQNDLKSICRDITNESYSYIKKFLSNTETKKKYKKLYDDQDVDVQDIEKSLDGFDIDCGISQHACLSSKIFDELIDGLNKELDNKYHDIIQKYKIYWDDKNSGCIWLTINSKSADKVLEE